MSVAKSLAMSLAKILFFVTGAQSESLSAYPQPALTNQQESYFGMRWICVRLILACELLYITKWTIAYTDLKSGGSYDD